jgi:hypothetical protein
VEVRLVECGVHSLLRVDGRTLGGEDGPAVIAHVGVGQDASTRRKEGRLDQKTGNGVYSERRGCHP